MIVLDTHVLLWLRGGSAKLGGKARRAIEKSHLSGDIFVSAITFWETAMLYASGRMGLEMGPASWRQRVLDDGVGEVAVTGDIGIRAVELLPNHPDPADRIIVATAQKLAAVLYTADTSLLGAKLPVRVVDAAR